MDISTLHPVRHEHGYRNQFCVPAALSAALGISVQEAAARLREATGKRSVHGVAPRTAEEVIRSIPGLWASTHGEIILSHRPMRFCQWIEQRDQAAREQTFLVSLAWPMPHKGHMLAVRGNLRADNIYGGPKPVSCYSMRWAPVRALTIILPDDWSGPYPYGLPEALQ